MVVYDPTAQIEPGINSYGEQVEVVAHASLAGVIDEVHKTPAHAVVLGADSVTGLLPLLQAAASQLPDTPLLGWALPLRTAPALRAGADHYLVKPLSLATLKEGLAAVPQTPAAGPGRRRRRRSTAPAGAHAGPARRGDGGDSRS